LCPVPALVRPFTAAPPPCGFSLSLHDALPIWLLGQERRGDGAEQLTDAAVGAVLVRDRVRGTGGESRHRCPPPLHLVPGPPPRPPVWCSRVATRLTSCGASADGDNSPWRPPGAIVGRCQSAAGTNSTGAMDE